MWKKLALLAAVASAVRQLIRQWKQRDVKARDKSEARTDLQRWEDEGGNLPPKSEAMPARAAASKRTAGGGSRASASAPF